MKKSNYRLIEDANYNYKIQRRFLIFWITIWDSDLEALPMYEGDARKKFQEIVNKGIVKTILN